MSYMVCIQPNGYFCLFSSMVDDITIYDATASEILSECEKLVGFTEAIRMLSACARKPTAFAMALNDISVVHGSEVANEWNKKLSFPSIVTEKMIDDFKKECAFLGDKAKEVFCASVRIWNEHR